jgi:N-acyl-D-amino-acid deacylase
MERRLIHYLVFSLVVVLYTQCKTNHYDIVITNGTVYDGTGNAPGRADIGITSGYISGIGVNLSTRGATVVDASNLIVAPGFIDIHTHCDSKILEAGMNSLRNYLTQGVTTVVTGNCGDGTYEVEDFFHRLDSIGTGTNIVHLVGHNSIRYKVMGLDNREPTAGELEEMKKMVIVGMESGAAGISTGLFYTPGAYSSTSEVVELAKIVKEYDGFYATHLRDESNYTVGLEEAVKEAISIGEQTGIRVEIAHIKALGEPVWGISTKICAMIAEARNRGVHVFADQYPYNASSTGLSAAIVPGWAVAGGQLKQRLNNPKLILRIKNEIVENIDRRGGPESMVIISYPNDHRFDGKNIKEISRIIKKPPVETAIFLILDGNPGIVSFNMNDSDIVHFMKREYVMTSSDGNIEVPGNSAPHPRSYGAFPRKIRKYVFEDKIISMEQAIKAATSMPADMIGLKDRGYLKIGKVADIVVFNPGTIRDMATFAEPHQYSAGVEYLLINGNFVIDKGQYNGKLAGKPIRIIR